MQWYGYVTRRGEQEPTQRVLSMTVQGEMPRGIPCPTLMVTILIDMRANGMRAKEVLDRGSGEKQFNRLSAEDMAS